MMRGGNVMPYKFILPAKVDNKWRYQTLLDRTQVAGKEGYGQYWGMEVFIWCPGIFISVNVNELCSGQFKANL